MPKFAIYTAVVGNYDEISQPLVVDPRFDYFLFSDSIKEEHIGIWQIKPIEYYNPDRIKIARYVKTHPETLLPDYAATLWMDANIQIVDSWVYERFLELYSQGVELASVKHPERDCIYQEIFAVCSVKWETVETAWRWNRVLRQNNYPKHNGLFETGVTYRMHTPSIRKIDEDWWNCIEQYSRRDQLSFNFILWRCGRSGNYFFIGSESASTSSHFKYVIHKNGTCKGVSEKAFIMYLWDYYGELPSSKKTCFQKKWLSVLSMPYRISQLTFYIWRQSVRFKRDCQRYMRELKVAEE